MKRRSRIFRVAALACALWQASFAVAAAARRATPQEGAQVKTQSRTTESPFFCNLSALDQGQRKHHRELTQKLREAVEEVRELEDGYAFRLRAETARIRMVAEWVSLERLCCPFFSFQLEVGSPDQPLWLRITGRDGVKAFMQSEFEIEK